MTSLSDLLHGLYADASKHSNYQNIPAFVRDALGYTETINENWRGDTARYQYIVDEVEFPSGALIGDIGANTGFFALSLAHQFPKTLLNAYESNANHAEFIRAIARHFELDNIKVVEQLIQLRDLDSLPVHDVMLHLNVLHHAGHDFDSELVKKVEDFEVYAFDYLKRIREKTYVLVFQMGSNWGGNKAHPLVPSTDDYGKLLLNLTLLKQAGWTVSAVALATKDANGKICYRNLSQESLEGLLSVSPGEKIQSIVDYIASFDLDQFVGEFYRRPLIVCRNPDKERS